MKRLLLTFAIILQGMTLAQSYAQSHAVNNTDSIEILKFKNIPIKGNIKDFDLKMRDENFIFIGNLYSTYNYIGMFYGRKVDAKVQYVPETKQVSKVVVVFPEVGEEANDLYEHLIKQLDKKYRTRQENFGDDELLIWSYGREYEIILSKGHSSKKVFLNYTNKAKSEERYYYQNKHAEWMTEHQNDL